MIITQLIMVAIMTITPIHIEHHGHAITVTGIVIGAHVAGMFLPSPFSGWLVDRFGYLVIAVAAGVTLLAAGLIAAWTPVDSVPLLVLALVLLGVGWNLGLAGDLQLLWRPLEWLGIGGSFFYDANTKQSFAGGANLL